MGKLLYLSAVQLLLHASLTYGWGPPGGGGWSHPSWPQSSYVPVAASPPPPPPATSAPVVYTTQTFYTPPAPVQTTAAVNPDTVPANPQTSLPGDTGGATSAVAAPTGTGAQPSGSSTPNSCGTNVQKISLDNQSGGDLIIQAGAPWTVGNCGTISSGSTCTFCLPRGSTGGNLQVGLGSANSRGTWIEGNWVTSAEWATVDISFIPGYSVPISCTSDITGATNGWGSPLCTDATCSNCNSGGGTWDGTACQNPAGDGNNPLPNGPCPSFFSSSAGGAYCYPNDNGVVGFGEPWSSVSCTAGAQSGTSSKAKRDSDKGLVQKEIEKRSSTLKVRGAAQIAAHAGARVHARNLKQMMY